MSRRIDVRIDRIVLHGAGPGDRVAYAAALRREIARAIPARAGEAGGTRDIAAIDAGRAPAGGEGAAVAQAIAGAMTGRAR